MFNDSKSRASSTLSDASTIKDLHLFPPVPRERTITVNSSNLMDVVFNSVVLPSVEFTSTKGAEIQALDHIDSALANEESHSYRSSVSSLNSPLSPAAEAIAHDLVEEVLESHYNKDKHNHDHELAELERRHKEEQEKAAELIREMEDAFDENGLHSRRSSFYSHRGRSMTMDSQASLAESRFGDFQVHDDNDNYKGEDLDLYHNEVAYERVKKPKIVSALDTNGVTRPNEADVQLLEEYNRQLTQAKQKIAFLEDQIRARGGTIVEARAGSISFNGRSHSYAGSSHNERYASEIDAIYEEDVGVSPIARAQLEAGTEMEPGPQVARAGKKAVVVPQQREIGGVKLHPNIHKIVIGGQQHSSEDDKTVLLFGPVGSGKTSLINSMLNYLYDVKRENGFRFALSEHTKPSHSLRAYVFNNTILPFSLTIVDTPGVPDVKGDRTVSTLVQAWFEHELMSAGEFRLDAISIVLTNNERRLEWPFIHELAAVKRMFGDDLKTNVLPIITNTEVLPQPVAVRALASANIAFLEYYKVNNAGFFPEAPSDINRLKHNLFYRHGIASLEKYFKDLQELIHPLLATLRARSVPNALLY